MTHSGTLACGRYQLKLSRPIVMGIINTTPDSFSDGGRYTNHDAALLAIDTMIEAGVDIIDIGGESTRPGATPVPVQQEIDRVIPLIEILRDCGKPLSVDTYKPQVMQAAIACGVDMINDVRALTTPGAITAVKPSDCALIIMHMAGNPHTMQLKPSYQNIVAELQSFFQERLKVLDQAGINRQRILIDPGFGFGKNLAHNLDLLRHLSKLIPLGLPLVVGLSRKSMLGNITDKAVDQRQAASIAASVLAAEYGATLHRVHDVAGHVDALKIWSAVHEKPWCESIATKISPTERSTSNKNNT